VAACDGLPFTGRGFGASLYVEGREGYVEGREGGPHCDNSHTREEVAAKWRSFNGMTWSKHLSPAAPDSPLQMRQIYQPYLGRT
jgi:hypothetical protein